MTNKETLNKIIQPSQYKTLNKISLIKTSRSSKTLMSSRRRFSSRRIVLKAQIAWWTSQSFNFKKISDTPNFKLLAMSTQFYNLLLKLKTCLSGMQISTKDKLNPWERKRPICQALRRSSSKFLKWRLIIMFSRCQQQKTDQIFKMTKNARLCQRVMNFL